MQTEVSVVLCECVSMCCARCVVISSFTGLSRGVNSVPQKLLRCGGSRHWDVPLGGWLCAQQESVVVSALTCACVFEVVFSYAHVNTSGRHRANRTSSPALPQQLPCDLPAAAAV
jgi:hypothetical protein